jgi:hypothetical protein
LSQKTRHFTVLVVIHHDMSWLLLRVQHILLILFVRRNQMVRTLAVYRRSNPDGAIVAIDLRMSVAGPLLGLLATNRWVLRWSKYHFRPHCPSVWITEVQFARGRIG